MLIKVLQRLLFLFVFFEWLYRVFFVLVITMVVMMMMMIVVVGMGEWIVSLKRVPLLLEEGGEKG